MPVVLLLVSLICSGGASDPAAAAVLSEASPQLTDTILMVRPVDFGYNAETGADNVFEHKVAHPSTVTGTAMREFEGMVDTLRGNGINVLVLDGGHGKVKTPDAVFPNNWVTVDHDGSVTVYPMKAADRRAETRRIGDVMNLLHKSGFMTRNEPTYVHGTHHAALEGTGALVIDHRLNVLYAALSERCNANLLESFAHQRHYAEPVTFHTKGSSGKPIYHTNVMMSIGDKFAVICSDCISNAAERKIVLDDLRQAHEIIEISVEQTEMHFCANILQLASSNGESRIVMSQNAYNGFTEAQRQRLSIYGKLVPVDIDTIEAVGGGSARCMMAQVFAPKKGPFTESTDRNDAPAAP